MSDVTLNMSQILLQFNMTLAIPRTTNLCLFFF